METANIVASSGRSDFQSAQAADPKLEQAFQLSLKRSAEIGERRISWIRVGAYGSVALLDVVLGWAEIRPAENVYGSAPVAMVSLLLWWFLHRFPVTERHHTLIPLVDALIVYWLLSHRALDAAGLRGMATSTALVCAVVAASGGLRLKIRAVLWSTGLAGLLYFWFVARNITHETSALANSTWAYGTVALAGVGLLAIWTVQLAKDAARLSQARVVLQRFLPENLVDQAFDRPDGDWSRPRSIDATILFSDIRGFTSWSESRMPEEVLLALSDLQGRLADAVQKEGGFVDKFLGDGMLAVFGTSDRDCNHATQAIMAIQRMRKGLVDYNQKHNAAFRLGIAAHSGPVVLGCLGNVDRLEMTVIGDTVNATSRLEAETKNYNEDVLISGATAERADLDLPKIGAVTPRGKSESLTIHALPRA